jgi:hypothetical protein
MEMKRLAVLVSSLVLTLAALVAGGTSTAAHTDRDRVTWHRLNPNQDHPGPEHERLTCSQRHGNWQCRYDKVQERRLNFYWDTTVGRFSGRDVTASWACPTWFTDDVCKDVTQVVRGEGSWVLPDGSAGGTTQELVFTGSGRDQVLRVHFPEWGFACPWYRTFRRALAANPFPLPFDGTHWPADSCLAAPATAG